MKVIFYSRQKENKDLQAAGIQTTKEECLQQSLQEYISNTLPDSELICSGGDIESDLEALYADVLIYDMSGEEPETAKSRLISILQQKQGCIPILLADDESFALFGYKIHAFDYLLHPVEGEELVNALERLIRRKHSHLMQAFPIKIKGTWSKLEAEHISYLETSNHHTIFHMDDGAEFVKPGNFQDLLERLNCNPFLFQCHKSYVVNGKHIESMQQTGFIMKGGKKVSISRPYRKGARLFYAWCMTGVYATEQDCLPVDISL